MGSGWAGLGWEPQVWAEGPQLGRGCGRIQKVLAGAEGAPVGQSGRELGGTAPHLRAAVPVY